jgi:hypothetical protein
MSEHAHGICPGCNKANQWLMLLHGDRGGPLRCFMCAGAWNAEHTRRRKWQRIIVKAMNMYLHEGGKWTDLEKFTLFAGGGLFDSSPAGIDEVPDITSELLDDVLQLVHPDRHASEQQQLAKRATQELLALRPFVFPKPKPKPQSNPVPTDPAVAKNIESPKQPSFPCELCADILPSLYCDACRRAGL